MSEKVFNRADIVSLKAMAKQVGIYTRVPHDILEAQSLKNQGLDVPGDLDPEEAFFLLEISNYVADGGKAPEGFVIYLNDRINTNIPEDVPTLMTRKTRNAFNNLLDTVKEVNSLLEK